MPWSEAIWHATDSLSYALKGLTHPNIWVSHSVSLTTSYAPNQILKCLGAGRITKRMWNQTTDMSMEDTTHHHRNLNSWTVMYNKGIRRVHHVTNESLFLQYQLDGWRLVAFKWHRNLRRLRHCLRPIGQYWVISKQNSNTRTFWYEQQSLSPSSSHLDDWWFCDTSVIISLWLNQLLQ